MKEGKHMRHVTIFIFLFSMVFSKALLVNTNETPLLESTKSAMVIEDFNKENTRNPSSREDIILFDWNFESEESAWNTDSGWEWTDASAADTSIYSYLSPNTEATYGSVWNLTSPNVTLPALGDGEVMRFKFSLWGDMPDTDGDADDFLDDYYNLSIMDLEALSWHASSAAPAADGNSYWCADEDIGPDGGYLDEWMQYLDTPATMIGDNASVSANMTWNLESPAGADGAIAGSCTNGWDAANVRISIDGGTTWELLEDPNNPYDFDCGYGWIYNDAAYEAGGALNNVAAGWGGALTNALGQPIWADTSFDLSAYSGQEVIVRFAFGSDPSYSTFDQTDMTGFVVDNIMIEDATGVQYSDNADDSSEANTMIPSGEVWEAMFYDYTDATRPGGNGWEEYLPGLAFNGNVLHDISHLAGKEIIVKFASRYDDNDDGGAGQGLFIDDFIIYKESSGSFPAPANLMVESGDEEAMLTWQDMNASGTFGYNYTNGTPTNSIVMNDAFTSYAGERFDIVGASTVNSIDIYNSATTAVTVNLVAFTKQGALFNAEPAFTKEVTLAEAGAWNTIDMSLDGWTFTSGFILGHSFDNVISAALDETAIPSTNSMILFSGGSWGTWQESANNSAGAVSDGEWGIGASITQDGANVTYSVQRDGVQVATALTSNMHTDTGLINNTEYSYSVSATYEDGTESDPSESVTVIPQAQTVHQESHDDGTSEAGWAPEGSGQFAAVRYAAHDGGEQVMRYKWFQEGGGGAFYIKLWADDNGYPGTEIYSGVQVSGNSDGWNEVDLSSENLTVTCDFWVGVKRFSSTAPIGVDTDSNTGNSMSSDNGTDWMAVEGNVMVRIFIDEGDMAGEPCISLSNTDELIPSVFNISNAYPNPFNPSTTVNIDIPEAGMLKVGVYNLKGQLMSTIMNENVFAGSYSIVWNGADLTSGLYIMSVNYGNKTYNQKITLVK